MGKAVVSTGHLDDVISVPKGSLHYIPALLGSEI